MPAVSCPGAAFCEQHQERWRPVQISLAGGSETCTATTARAPQAGDGEVDAVPVAEIS
jgi:hypothetical protein